MLIDDDKVVHELITLYFESRGHEVSSALNKAEALQLLYQHNYDIFLLDIMLRDDDGIQLCKAIREYTETPIIMLSAIDEEISKVKALEMGADDYLTKPFGILELEARIKAILKRGPITKPKEGSNPTEIIMDDLTQRISYQGASIQLTNIEYSLLSVLILNFNKPLSRIEIIKAVWGREDFADYRTVDVYINRLRKKLQAIAKYEIEAVRNYGYLLRS